LRAGEWWVLRIVTVVLGVVLGAVFLNGAWYVTLLGLVLGFLGGLVVPSFVLKFLAKRRGKKFDAQLPDVLTLVASSLSTGFSLLQALDAVAKDAAEPAAKEFSRALAETRIGADVSDALERMSTRMDSDNMRWTSMAIRIQREVGGNLAETLKTTAKTLREREALRRHVRALSAEGRLSAYILIGLPIGIFFYTMQTNREYIELLWIRPMGLAMMGAGIISLGIGVFWMRKVVDVQV
jgi:tight adherence protein B